MDLPDVLEKAGLALGLGLLVGLQRERVHSTLAGVRTFALITVLGTFCALLSLEFGGWIVAAGLIGVAGLMAAGNLGTASKPESDPGLTTEITAVLMYSIGAYVVVGHAAFAIAATGVVAVLLHWKGPIHRFIAQIGEDDLRAVMQFVLIALVILPILPDRTYGPYQVLNPRNIWFMVVLIVGIGLAGYIAHKLLGHRRGAVIAGLLGGLISSTATTLSHARRTKTSPDLSTLAALVIMLASAVAIVRVLVEIAVVAPASMRYMAPPLAIFAVLLAVLSVRLYLSGSKGEVEQAPLGNPAELRPAIAFGALYAGVLLGVAAAKDLFAETGLYVVAVLSGLTDMDAITLSTARLAEQERLEVGTAWRIILVAAMSNLVFKGVLVGVLGHRRLFVRIALAYSLAIVGGVLLVFLWPRG
jgi:uncharacterized membrane protein (DUF4010 family)